MKQKISLLMGMLLAGMAVSSAGWAAESHFHDHPFDDHFHDHFDHPRIGIDAYIGDPFGPYPYYYPPYYYYPPNVPAPASPPVYIEQEQATPSSSNYWYYCGNPRGFYPTVKECPDGWHQVPPRASSH